MFEMIKGFIKKSGEEPVKKEHMRSGSCIYTFELTDSRYEVSNIFPLSTKVSEEELLSMAASAVAKTKFSIGKNILDYAERQKIPIFEALFYEEVDEAGVCAEVFSKQIHCGNKKYFESKSIPITDNVRMLLEGIGENDESYVLIAEENKCIGLIELDITGREK